MRKRPPFKEITEEEYQKTLAEFEEMRKEPWYALYKEVADDVFRNHMRPTRFPYGRSWTEEYE